MAVSSAVGYFGVGFAIGIVTAMILYVLWHDRLP